LAPFSRLARCCNCAYTSRVILESACPTCFMTHTMSKLFAKSAVEMYVRRIEWGVVCGSAGKPCLQSVLLAATAASVRILPTDWRLIRLPLPF
jgi:hypothetical protein